MPKKGKAPKEDVADTQDDDPSVRRIPEKPPPLPMQPKVLPTTISPPVPLLPLWDETKVMNTYTKKKEDDKLVKKFTSRGLYITLSKQKIFLLIYHQVKKRNLKT